MTGSLAVGGLRLAYRLDGPADAPPLVFINSLGTDWRMWDAQAAALAGHFRIVRYDTRGHGQSGVPTEPATLAQLGGDLLALLDHLGIAQAARLRAVARRADRALAGRLSSGAGRAGGARQHGARASARWRAGPPGSPLSRPGGMEAVRETVVGRFLSAEFRRSHPAVTEAVGTMLTATDPAGYIAACAAVRDGDLRPIVSTIQVPVLIIGGALDESTPPAQADDLHAAIVGSELVIFPHAAHLTNIEQPERFNECLLTFLT